LQQFAHGVHARKPSILAFRSRNPASRACPGALAGATLSSFPQGDADDH
jgi:hypothetical protein